MEQPDKILRCPHCGGSTTWNSEPRGPFCSRRCQLIDLGCWADEKYSLPAGEQDDESGETPFGQD
ncbi:MAG: DNA gyrase inhibitor YacG [Candidatus Alcyoniella australis]|nr:DNA gyrase inhibitor YacG [Candidatus Alcyoniella australis]